MSDVSFKVSFGWSSRVWALTYLQNVPNNLWKQNHGDEKCEYSPSGFDHLLCHIVEEVPAAEGEGRLQEGERDLPNRRRPLQREGHLRRQCLVVSWWLHETSELLALPQEVGKPQICWGLADLPLKIWTRPTTMMRPNAISFPTVKTSWILVAMRTLEQFTQVSSTEPGTEPR